MSPLPNKKTLASRRPPLLPLDRCLAKVAADSHGGMSVEDHMRITGLVARQLLNRMPKMLRSVFPQGIAALVASHDIGKVSPGFQREIWQNVSGGIPEELRGYTGLETKHAEIGESAVRAYYHSALGCTQGADWAWAIGAHHGVRNQEPRSADAGVFGGTEWQAERNKLLCRLFQRFGTPPTSKPEFAALTAATGFLCVADWLASDEAHFAPGKQLPPEEELKQHIDALLDDAGWQWPRVRPDLDFCDLFSYTPNEVQDAAYELADSPGLLVVESPMGTGKTEAALWAAYRLIRDGHNHGLYFGLPTRITSNLIHQRVSAFLQRAFPATKGARLLHADAWLTRTPGGEELSPGGSWFAPAKRGLLWPFGVGTIDQALLGVVNVKHFFLRLFGLAGKVVILDEVHSYDVYTGTLVDELIRCLLQLGCSVIVLSATLTQQRRAELGCSTDPHHVTAYPLLTKTSPAPLEEPPVVRPLSPIESQRREVNIKWEDDTSALLESLRELLRNRSCIVTVHNTVAGSQQFYCQLKSYLADGQAEIGLLHANFPPWRRAELETNWINLLGKNGDARRPAVLSATQVVEQSVDIDADVLVTEIAPMDMLLQRMGRLWRHQRSDRPVAEPVCYVLCGNAVLATNLEEFNEAVGPSRFVYAPYVLWRTLRALEGCSSIRLPEDIRTLLEATYVNPQGTDPAWVLELHRQFLKRQEELRQRALVMQSGSLPPLSDSSEVTTRYSESTRAPVLLVRSVQNEGQSVRVVTSQGKEVYIVPGCRLPHAIRDLHNSIVSVRCNWVNDIDRGPDWARRLIDSEVRILCIQRDGSLRTPAGTPTSLRYTDDLGLHRHRDTGPQVPCLSCEESSHESDELQSDW